MDNTTHDLHSILSTKSLRKEHINEDDVIEITGNVKDHFFELKLVIEAHQMEYGACTFNDAIAIFGHYKEVYNGYGNIFTTTSHINEDKSKLSQIFIEKCISKGDIAVPYLVSTNGASSNLTISVNGSYHQISKKRLIGLSSYIKSVLATQELVKIPKDGFGRKLKKYLSFLQRVSELIDN